MARIKEQAICIRLIDWSETSQIVALLTEGMGKVRGIARGAKRTSPGSIARYSGGIELLTLGQVVGIHRPSSELANLTEWDLQQPYRHLRENLKAQRLGLYAADVVNALLADHDPHPNVFAETSQYLESLADPEAHAPALLRFQWRLLEDCGYRPQLDRDVHTDEALPKRAAYLFDPHKGGVTQEGATPTNGDAGPWRVRRQTVELLAEVAGGQIPDVTPDAMERANRLLCVYMRTILDRELPTMRIVLGSA